MSSNEDPKPKDVTEEAHSPSPKGGGGGAYLILFFLLGLTLMMVVGWMIFPKVLYSKKSQPFDFNHKLHLEQVDDGCQSCHFFRKDGTFSGVPRLAQCTDCHEEVIGESKNEAVFVEQYVQKGREVPWHVYARQPDCVFFSHAAHVKGADMDCVTCHGHTGTSESLKPYEENRLQPRHLGP
jgi:menaquinone reductase, multiheme cytochrome c subunit